MTARRQLLEDAVIITLRQRLGKPVGHYLEAVEPYNGEIDQTEGPDDLIRKLRGRSPAILIATASGVYASESVARNRWSRTVSLELYMASSHLRSRESRVRADVVAQTDPTSDPGIYQMLEDVFDVVAGNDFGLAGVGVLSPSREDTLVQEEGFTVWRVIYTSVFDAIGKKHDASDVQWTDYQIDSNLVDNDGETVLPTPPNPFAEADGTL